MGSAPSLGVAASDAGGSHRLPDPRRLLIVSHPCVIAVNQAVYLSMLELGWDILLVVPARWRHEYSSQAFAPEVLPGMEGKLLPLHVVLPGRPQRHLYLTRPTHVIKRFRPNAIFLEQESFACAAMQWGLAARRFGLPFGVQSDENLDRRMPLAARFIRRWVLDRADFIAARSPTAAARVTDWGAKGRIAVVPHALPQWTERQSHAATETFTVGFAGRLVPEKGVMDLVEAVRHLPGPVRLLVVGNGPLRAELETIRLPNGAIEVKPSMSHSRMPEAYAEMDVLVLPSRTTSTWSEQFGRVLIEALSCGVPVVGSDSGEIPWVVNTTAGGQVFREGDTAQLTGILGQLRASPATRARLVERGRAMVAKVFAADACAAAMSDLLRP